MWAAVLHGLDRLSARNLPPLHLPESTGESLRFPFPFWEKQDWKSSWTAMAGLGLAKVPSWTRAACPHWGCWSRSCFSSLPSTTHWLCGDASVSLNQHKSTRSQMGSCAEAFRFLWWGAQICQVQLCISWAQTFLPYWKQLSNDWQLVFWAAVVDPRGALPLQEAVSPQCGCFVRVVCF